MGSTNGFGYYANRIECRIWKRDRIKISLLPSKFSTQFTYGIVFGLCDNNHHVFLYLFCDIQIICMYKSNKDALHSFVKKCIKNVICLYCKYE